LILLLFTFYTYSQEIVEKRIDSKLEEVVIEFDLIDNIQLFNNHDGSDIIVRAEGAVQTPNYQLKEHNGHVLIKDYEPFDADDESDADKVCSIEPNYTSYQIYIPKNRILYVSFIEGNFYSESYQGDLNLKVEDGILKLSQILGQTNIQLNSGSVIIHEIKSTKIDAETNLGTLLTDLADETQIKDSRKLLKSDANPNSSLIIRAILANIYLYGSKG